MTTLPIAILGVGMVTGVGLTAEASCAAIRSATDNFQETNFVGEVGEWLIGSEVPLERRWYGRKRLTMLLAKALDDRRLTLPAGVRPEQIPLIVNLPEEDRPGRPALGDGILDEVAAETGLRFHRDSRVIAQGRVGGAVALHHARRLIYSDAAEYDCAIVAGADSLLVGPTLSALKSDDRVLTAKNSNGFIPGEAAGAVVVAKPDHRAKGSLVCLGLGFAREAAKIGSGRPLRADGLSKAIKAALDEAGNDMSDMDFRLCDANREQYGFKEAALALTRVMRKLKDEFDIWHPADCIGEVGAAVLPCMLGVAFIATEKGYAPGPRVLCHLSNDDGKRAALVVRRLENA